METILFIYLPIVVGLGLIVLTVRRILDTKRWLMRSIQITILLLLVYATLGQIFMIRDDAWPTGLFMLIIVICGIVQLVLHMVNKKALKL